MSKRKSRHRYTVFCKSDDSDGTTWIGGVTATSEAQAIRKGREQCAFDWGREESDELPRCIGLVKGWVHVLQWDDEETL